MSESLSYILTKLEQNHVGSTRGDTYECKQRFYGFLMMVSGKVTLVLKVPPFNEQRRYESDSDRWLSSWTVSDCFQRCRTSQLDVGNLYTVHYQIAFTCTHCERVHR